MGYNVHSKTIRTDSSIFKYLQRIYRSSERNVGNSTVAATGISSLELNGNQVRTSSKLSVPVF
jgi:hypothetical protein